MGARQDWQGLVLGRWCLSLGRRGTDSQATIANKSCNGEYACTYAGYNSVTPGSLGIGQWSCNGYFVCYQVGYGHEGTIGRLSCNNYRACYQIASTQDDSIGNHQCNAPEECK
jgi:hypothetical protein